MRTLLFLLAGFLLLGACVLLGRLFSSSYPGAARSAVIVFGVVWLLIAGANMWIGVAKAGYSVKDELPIFALIFLAPVVVAVVLRWRGA